VPETISYVTSVVVAAGPKFTFSETIAVEAYNRITLTVKTKTSQKVILGTAGSEIRLLGIKSTKYMTNPAVPLTFAIDAVATEYSLDMPVVLAGKASIALLGAATPTSLTFNNQLPEDVTLEVLIARDPTP
jgi:hypothetical protein